MNIRRGDRVKLLPTWPHPENPATPVWGGRFGYRVGQVIKTLTHDPDKDKHQAIIFWSKDCQTGITEKYLQKVGEPESDVAEDFANNFTLENDIWAVIKLPSGKFVLNMIEANPYLADKKHHRYTVTLTNCPIPEPIQCTSSVINQFLSLPESCEFKRGSLYEAVSAIYEFWNCEPPASFPLPLGEYPSISAIQFLSSSTPAGKQAIFFFHLPKNLAEYATQTV